MKTYKVCGDREVLGHSPGTTFDADIPTAQESRLMQRGQLEVAGNGPIQVTGDDLSDHHEGTYEPDDSSASVSTEEDPLFAGELRENDQPLADDARSE